MVELKNKVEQKIVRMSDMRDGQIAVITGESYRGKIVQYVAPSSFTISMHTWIPLGQVNGKIHSCKDKQVMDLEVRILEDGEELIVRGNKWK
jgi:hypothetical protein